MNGAVIERTIHLDRLIPESYKGVYWDIMEEQRRHYWFAGGRGSGKSTFISIMIALGMIMDEKANAVVFRRTKTTLWDSVYKQVTWALDALGCAGGWRFMKAPMEIVNLRTGQRVMFRGADDPSKMKSIKPGRGYFKFLWFEELTEFRGMDDLRSIIQSVGRGTEHFTVFSSYNPPKSANNWTNAEALQVNTGRVVHKSSYLTMPREWLGPVFLDEAELLKQTNERAYRNAYLGEVTGTGGQVFDNVVDSAITPDELAGVDRYYYGLDFGFAVDPDALVECAYNKRLRILYITREFYGVRTPTEMLADRAKVLGDGNVITCDSADPRMINSLRRAGVVNAIAAKKGPRSVEHGCRWLQELAAIRVDSRKTPNVAREFLGYEYRMDRLGNFMADYPDKDNHTIDAVRYAVEVLSTARVATTLDRSLLGL